MRKVQISDTWSAFSLDTFRCSWQSAALYRAILTHVVVALKFSQVGSSLAGVSGKVFKNAISELEVTQFIEPMYIMFMVGSFSCPPDLSCLQMETHIHPTLLRELLC